MQTGRVEDADAVRQGCDQTSQTQLSQHSSDHLAHRTHCVGELLLRGMGDQRTARALLEEARSNRCIDTR